MVTAGTALDGELGDPSRLWTATYSQAGGYSFDAKLELGLAHRASTGLAVGSAVSGTCTFDTQTDALIPYRLTLTNTTPGFAAQVAGLVRLGSFQAEARFSDGPTCETDGTLGVQSTEKLDNGRSIVNDGFLVVPNFYTPDQPQGDPAALRNDGFGLATTSNDDGTVQLESLRGPGVGSPGFGFYPIALQIPSAD